MSGSIVQLVAKGDEDIYLTEDPQVTLFKMVYRRHVNFSVEEIPQKFRSTFEFGKVMSCSIGRNGDLVHRVYLVVKFPQIPKIDNGNDNITKFAWVRKIGYILIDYVQLEIGGEVIDTLYTDWLNIFAEINGYSKFNGYDKMIGNYPEIYNFTNGKDAFILYIPLEFSFFRSIGLAFPIIATYYTNISIHVKTNDFSQCSLYNPSHYIELDDSIVNFEPYEYLEQEGITATKSIGMFNSFDPLTKRLYYLKISDSTFISQTITSSSNIYNVTSNLLLNTNSVSEKFYIVGQKTGYKVMPKPNAISLKHVFTKLYTPVFRDAFLLVSYIFLDADERNRYFKKDLEYLIEKTKKSDDVVVQSNNGQNRIDIINPCKYIVWCMTPTYYYNINDALNYTDSYQYDDNGKQKGSDILDTTTILFNSIERISERNIKYFSCMEPYNYFNLNSNGIYLYSFSLNPKIMQPSGSCNTSLIQDIVIKYKVKDTLDVSDTNKTIFKCYGQIYDIMRISNGLAGTIFKS